MYATGVWSSDDGDEALASEYFGYLCKWWSSQIVLHVLEMAFMTQADVQAS